MALPLPKVVADVGPGGGLVTALEGMNALANNMHLRKINQVKAQYAPLTTQAEAASKLAYANLMAPQFIAKAMNNPEFMANLSEDQKKTLKNLVYGAGAGTQGLNALNQTQNNGVGQPSTNALSGWIANQFKNSFGQKSPQVINPLASPVPQQNVPSISPPVQAENDGINHELDAAMLDYFNSPEAKQPGASMPSEQELMERYRNKNGNPTMSMTLTEGQHMPQKSYAEKAGEYKGIIEEGKESGKIRATARKELDQEYQQALQLKAPFQKLNSIISNPIFQKLRQIPGFQQLQMDAKANFGNASEQKIIGEFQAAARNVVAATVKGFGGRILASEIPLSESMKLSDKDPIGVMLGKAPVIETFNEFTLQRARLASKLMQKYHMDKGDALEQADKMVDGKEIRRKIDNELNPITDADIDYTAKVKGMTREQVIQRLRAEGRFNG